MLFRSTMDDAVAYLPHSRYQHVFLIMRVDRSLPTNCAKESLKVKKVVMDLRYAEQEVGHRVLLDSTVGQLLCAPVSDRVSADEIR